MKKFLFTALALSVLASCSHDNVVDVNKGKSISFRTSLDKSTTRTTANESSLQNLEAFNVTAIGNGTNYFTDMSVTSDDQGATWKTEATYYWPDYGLAFFAYAPQDANANIDNTSKKLVGFTPAAAVADQKDLVVSYNTGTRANNESTGVPMNFKHALSQIEIKAKCPNDKMKIEVLGVKVVNVARTGDFTFPQEETDAGFTLGQIQWDNLTGGDDPDQIYMIKGRAPLTLDNTARSLMFGDNNLMLLPQQLTGWNGTVSTSGAYISVLCRISSLDGNNATQLYPPATGKYGFTAVAIDTNWEPGKKYIYTLEFCGENSGVGKIDPRPTVPSDPDIIDPQPGIPGRPILGKPIKFTVTVDSWDDQTESVTM